MKNSSLFLFFVLLISGSLFHINAQSINFAPVILYRDIPLTQKIQPYGVGSNGFDSNVNYFNPHYYTDGHNLKIFLYGNLNLIAKKEYNDRYGTESYSENMLRYMPGFSIDYWFSSYLLNLSYINDFQFYSKVSDTRFNFGTPQGFFQIFTSESRLNIKNNFIQLSLSKKLSDYNSAAIGISTNIFHSIYEFNDTSSFYKKFKVELYSGGFNNYQFSLAFNHVNEENISWYILFKSGFNHLRLKPSDLMISESVKIKYTAEMYYPPHLAYGLQFNMLNPFHFSLEMDHDNYSFSEYRIDTKLSLGFKYDLPSNITLGLLGSIYLDKKYNFSEAINGTPVSYYDGSLPLKIVSYPYLFIFGAGYRLNSFYLSFSYQYTLSNYISDIISTRDYSGYLLFSIGYEL